MKTFTKYFLGIIGLMPGIGLVTGLYLVISSWKKKERFLIFIGFLNIIVSTLFLILLLSTRFPVRFVNQAVINSSQSGVTRMIETIEYHKLINGVYPNSLDEVNFKDSTLKGADPVQIVTGNNNKNYYYSRTESGYILFSVGVDGIEFTDDDILPELERTDHIGYEVSHFHKKTI